MEWTAEAEARLKEIPFFVRPAARKKIEKLAAGGRGNANYVSRFTSKQRSSLGLNSSP